MRKLVLFLLCFLSTVAFSQGNPCYWVGQLTQCYPTTGIYLNPSNGTTRVLRFGDATTNYVQLRAPNAVTTYSLTLPGAQGAANQVMQNNGSGVLSWYTPTTGTVTSVSGTPPIQVATGTTTPVVSITQSGDNGNGYLSSSDWQTFNAKAPSSRAINTTSPLQGGGDLSADRTFTITQSGNNANGYLSSSDWQTFNSKGPGTVTSVSGTPPISVANGTTTPGISISQAGANGNGYLSSTDWNTFNNKPSSPVSLTNGGTGRSLTAVNGGIVWSDADSLEITAAGTASQWVLSGGAGTPTMSNTTTTGKMIDGSSDQVQLTVQGHSSQTTLPFVVENSGGTDVFTVSNTGNIVASAINLGESTLDFYEAGTWVPTIQSDSGTAGTWGTVIGFYYTAMGAKVCIQGRFGGTMGNANAAIRISLPLTATSAAGRQLFWDSAQVDAGTPGGILFDTNTSDTYFRLYATGNGFSAGAGALFTASSAVNAGFNFCYQR